MNTPRDRSRSADAVDFIVVGLQGPSNLIERIVDVGRPVVLIAEALGVYPCITSHSRNTQS
ncbi:hypothetical protein [Acidilobus sp.]|uniref:hypothetical protein n=1 Tax=Acidilobus sp. TaxID=1872109 RepID=UPI003D0557D8